MKTVFKVGMKVYDQINFPDMEGKVVKIHEDESKYPLGVCFNKKMSIHYYDLEGRFRKENIPTLSTKPYKIEFQGFEQKAPAPTYEDAVKWLESTEGTEIMNDSVFLVKGNYYTNIDKSTEALKKLILLRDYYNEGWQPDWKDNNWKHFILFDEGNLATGSNKSSCRVLFFKSEKVRNKFLEEQRELLEIAKPLL